MAWTNCSPLQGSGKQRAPRHTTRRGWRHRMFRHARWQGTQDIPASCAADGIVFEQLLRYAGPAVGLKPSARGCEARLRGLYRIMYSKTITSAVHAAPPHTNRMNIRFFLGGLRPPKPSHGRGDGETRLPHPPAGGPDLHASGGVENPLSPHPCSSSLCSRQMGHSILSYPPLYEPSML